MAYPLRYDADTTGPLDMATGQGEAESSGDLF